MTLLAAVFALGCGSSQSAERPLRSPSRDYPPVPVQTTADGDSLGAHRQDLRDALDTGPSIETGTQPGEQRYLAPGWVIEDGTPKYRPELRGNRNTSFATAPEPEREEEKKER